MAKELTPANTWHVTVTSPQAGDSRTAASVEVGLQDNADREEYLYRRGRLGEAVATAADVKTFTSGSWEDDTFRFVTLTGLKAGQKVHLHLGQCIYTRTGSTGGAVAKVRLAAKKSGGSDVALAATETPFSNNLVPTGAYKDFSLDGYYEIPSDGNYDFKLQGQATTDSFQTSGGLLFVTAWGIQ